MSVRRGKNPIHGIFQICSKLTPDPTWKDFLNQCSYGYFPSGVKFTNGNLVSNRKKNSFTVNIPEDPERALIVLINVFRDRLGIKSVKEKKSENIVFNKRVKDMVYNSWTEVKTKAGKVSLLGNYVQSMSEHYSMSDDEKVKVLMLLEFCVNAGALSKNEIIVQEGRIVSIKKFYFDPILRQSFYTGKFTENKVHVHPIPIYYNETPQIDLSSKFMNALKEHSEKLNHGVSQ